MGLSLRPLFAGPSKLTLGLLCFAVAAGLYVAFAVGPAEGLVVLLVAGGLIELLGWAALLAGDAERDDR